MFKLPNVEAMYEDMARDMPDQVTCRKCGATRQIDPAQCLRKGWPKCCGATMALGGAVLKQEPQK